MRLLKLRALQSKNSEFCTISKVYLLFWSTQSKPSTRQRPADTSSTFVSFLQRSSMNRNRHPRLHKSHFAL